MDHSNIIECGGFYFIHNFDSGNLGHVERVPTELIATSINSKTNTGETPDYEFNLWTRPDCAGTEFENGNRTWFYFGVQAPDPGVLVRLNLINLNKQGKMYNQGMAPVTRTLPGKPQWERIRDRPIHSTDDNTFTLSFKYRTAENVKATTFFAFTYPFSFAELQIALNSIDMKMLPLPPPQCSDDIYYCRECLIYSLEGRRVDLLTISSFHGITNEREERLKNLFPDKQERPFKFQNKKIIFISARVHPGETPSSFVFNGFLNLLLTRNDPIATQLRKHYVFKMIPFLNPDGVARGHYRTDTRGVNLNRVYLNPSLVYHPTVYASRALIRYYHYGCEKEDLIDDSKSFTSRSIQNINESSEILDPKKSREKKSHSPYKTSEYYKRDKPGKLVISNKSSTTIKQPSNVSENSRQIIVEHVHLVDQGVNDKRFRNEANDKTGKSTNKNKSSTNIKQPGARETKKNLKVLTGESKQLVEQVYDMKLQEQPSQTSSTFSKPSVSNIGDNNSILNDNTLRTCLGSSVHLSTSEELNIPGTNPLRPLRDTLKNSISLLMDSNSSITGESMTAQPTHPTNVKIGWCQECRMAVSRLEDTMPGITNMVPGYNLGLIRQDNLTYHTIDEYREVQKQKTDEHERNSPTYLSLSPTPEQSQKEEDLYFCTNCFKRYVITESNEEIKVLDIVSRQSVAVSAVSAGDSGVVRGEAHAQLRAGSTGDALPLSLSIHQAPEKPKSATTKGNKKKPTLPPTLTPTAVAPKGSPLPTYKEPESGLYLYIDLHGHASKKGIFMYGNHFEDLESCVECMLLPRIMSLNNLHFHFSSCNFTERNMYLKDRRDGMSREGSGRVAVLKATGLVRSYTLECNYNTGRLVNVLPPARGEPPGPGPGPAPATHSAAPPKYTPHIFEEVGRSLGASILDLTGQHPNSRIPCSEHRNLAAVRDWLRAHTRTMRPQLTMSRLRPKTSSPVRVPLYARSKGKVTEERKENTYVGAKLDERARPDTDKFAKKNEPANTPSRTRYFAENEPKPKTLAAKRRNAFDIRKPESSKIRIGGVAKVKSGRVADGADMSRTSSAKLRTFGRSSRGGTRSRTRLRGTASSSSEDVSGAAGGVAGLGTVGTVGTVGGARSPSAWDAPPKRRPPPARPPSLLKKIRLKAAL